MPQLSRAAIFRHAGSVFQQSSFLIPVPAPGEVLVKVNCATICGSDVHTWKGRRIEPTPCVLGHEIVGTILALGESPRHDLRGEPLVVGDRVTWTLAASCGDCFFCDHDLPQKCENLMKYGHTKAVPGRELLGGFAEYCLLAAGTGIVKVPSSLQDEHAAPANCAVATVAACYRMAGSLNGAVVVVLGCGVLGLYACAMARSMGAAQVIACDVAASREALARGFGADHFVLPEDLAAVCGSVSAGRGADVAIELSGSPKAVSLALEILRIGGTAMIAGTTTPCDPVALDPHQLMRRMLRVQGVHNYAPCDLVTAMDFLEAHVSELPLDLLSSGSFSLSEIDRAFEAAAAQPGTRVAIIP